MDKKTKGRFNIYYGWWMVLALTGLCFYASGALYYGFTSFFNPIRKEFGWTFAQTSLGTSLQRLEAGFLAPATGFLIDRYGPRKILLIGVPLWSLGFIVMSRMTSLWMFYAAFLIIAIGADFGAWYIGWVTAGNWFKKKVGRAMGVISAGSGVAGIMVPVLVWLIASYGWRASLFMVGAIYLVIGIPVALMLRHRPQQYGYLPDGERIEAVEEAKAADPASSQDPKKEAEETEVSLTWREAIRSSGFWLFSVGHLINAAAGGAVFVHIMPYLGDIGVSRETAALVISALTVFSILGRVGFGLLADIFDKRYVLAACFILQIVGLLFFAYVTSIWWLIPFMLFFGLGYGGALPLRPALQRDLFGPRNFATIQGFVMGITAISTVAAPFFAGWIRDVTGAYRLAFIITAVIAIPAVICILLVRYPQKIAQARAIIAPAGGTK